MAGLDGISTTTAAATTNRAQGDDQAAAASADPVVRADEPKSPIDRERSLEERAARKAQESGMLDKLQRSTPSSPVKRGFDDVDAKQCKDGAPFGKEKFFPDGKPEGTFYSRGDVHVDFQKLSTGTSDGMRYHVRWEPLDKDGKVQTTMSDEKTSRAMSQDRAIRMSPFSTNRSETLKPPYANPNGWRVTITVPPQEDVNANSAGFYTTVRTT